MKHLFIVNPTAGGKDHTGEVRARVSEAFKNRSDDYEIYVTKAAMDAPGKIREEAAHCDHLRVYACGGDGTFNECVCGAAHLSNVAVCPFPTGTGNDFCRMFGEDKELFRNIDALLEGFETPIDLIDCNGRYSANICSVGIDARIGTSVHKYSKLPIIGGAGGYIISVIVNVFKGISQHMKVKAGGFAADGEHTLICACNGRYYGGGFNPTTTARPDDGVMDIFVVKKVSILQVASLIGKYASGRIDEVPEFAAHLYGDELEIVFDKKSVINVDGEALYSDRVKMKLVPGAANLIVPKGLRFFEDEAAEQPVAASV